MDLISNMLSTLRLNASIFLHSSFCNAWVIDINKLNIATFHLISHGDCWLHIPNETPLALHEGDLVVLPHNATHLIANSPESPLESTPRNTPAEEISGPTVTLICGTVSFNQNYWNPLIDALPEYIILPTLDSHATTLGNVINALITECEKNEIGSEAIIDRLADILFIEVLRTYIKKETSNNKKVALTDPKIRQALEQFHENPGNNWTVEGLAEIACMSRSAFAKRFHKLLGTSPINYITRWRMQLAHRMITESSETIGDIAQSCAYHSEEAFGKAFRKEFGVSPKAVRRRESVNEIASMVSVNTGTLISSKILFSHQEVNQLRNNNSVVIIDIRDSEDYSRGHIPGAVNIPQLFTTLSMTTPEGLNELEKTLTPLFSKAGISRDKTVIFYEDDLDSRFGGSCRGYFQLTLLGHSNAGILDGGLNQWKADGYPLNTETTRPVPSIFKASLQRTFLATVDDVIEALDNPDIKMLDNRDKEEWLGLTSSPAGYYPSNFVPRRGRIPGARWIEWHHFMEATDSISHFRSPQEIISICAQAGLYPSDDIIIYCFKGARASNTFIALRLAGFKRLRNYYGSWNEWSRNASLPVMSVQLLG
jgi:thiosulfate/3-mercaptopyruvate sulfurtransferase